MGTSTCIEQRNSLDQAIHNEKVAEYISKKPDFSDWIITIRFYSALHYIRAYVIPYSIILKNGDEAVYSNFEDLYKNFKQDCEGCHGFQLRFVQEKHEMIAFEYQKLYEMSVNARYNNYEYTRENSTKSASYLKTIKEVCTSRHD